MFKKKLLLGMLVLALGLSGWAVSSTSAKSLDLSSQSAQSQGNPPNGRAGDRKGPRIDLAAAAETLGVTEAELQAALGDGTQGKPDLAAAAETLGVTETELHDALGIPEREAKTLDLTAAAETLGVSEADLQAAFGDGTQGKPDLAAAAETLGVTETELHDALGIPEREAKTLALAAAAETLGVSEADLQAALGNGTQGKPDLAAAAETLGVTETELHDALGFHNHAPENGKKAPVNTTQG